MNAKIGFLRLLLKNWPALYFRWIRIPRVCTATQDAKFWNLHAQLLKDGRCTQFPRERYNLWSLARQVQTLEGAFAEAGVYDGGSARILCEAKGAEHLHLFDTFDGMPETDPKADPHFVAGQFADTNRLRVESYLAAFPMFTFIKVFSRRRRWTCRRIGASNLSISTWIFAAPHWTDSGIFIRASCARASLFRTITAM